MSAFVWFNLVLFSLDPNLSFRSFVPGRRSIGFIDSKVAVICGVVWFSTFLTEWVHSFWVSFGSVTIFIVLVVVIVVAVFSIVSRVELLGPLIFSGINLSASVCSFCLFCWRHWFRYCQHFFTMVACWFGTVGIRVCTTLADSVVFHLIKSFQTVLIQILFKVCNNLFPDGTDLLISSGVVSSWPKQFVQGWHVLLFRMRRWQVFDVYRENRLIFDLLDWRQISEVAVLLLRFNEVKSFS